MRVIYTFALVGYRNDRQQIRRINARSFGHRLHRVAEDIDERSPYFPFFLSFFLSFWSTRYCNGMYRESEKERERERQREEKIETGNKGMSRKRVAGVEAAPESTQP